MNPDDFAQITWSLFITFCGWE